MFERPHWSYSQLAQYLRCPLQYFFERIAKLPRPFVAHGLVFGSAIHEALAEYHRHLQLDQPVEAEHIRSTFRAVWQAREAETPVQYCGADRGALIEQGTAIIDLHLAASPPSSIEAVEERIVVPLCTSNGEYLDRPLVAIVDLLTREGGQLTVTEFKTSARRYSDNAIDRMLQATCYRHAVEERYDEPTEVQYRVLVKTQTPAIQELPVDANCLDTQRLGDLAQAVGQAIQANIFYPVESAMNCSTCPFYRPCREWPGAALATSRFVLGAIC